MPERYPQSTHRSGVERGTVPDRRAHPRREVAIEGKVIAPGWARYARARTRDLSEGGALLVIDGRGGRLSPGQRLRVAIGGPGVVRSDQLREASVVRVTGSGVAVRFAA